MPKTQTCSRCNTEIARPHTEHANYVRSLDFGGPEPHEVFYAMVHTEETESLLDDLDEAIDGKNRQLISAESAHPHAPEFIEVSDGTKIEENGDGWVETAALNEIEFSIPVEKFEHREVDSPNVVQDDQDVALTYSTTEEKEVPKTGVICGSCTKDDDEIIWGIDE